MSLEQDKLRRRLSQAVSASLVFIGESEILVKSIKLYFISHLELDVSFRGRNCECQHDVYRSAT